MANATVELAERFCEAEVGEISTAGFIIRGLLACLTTAEQERDLLSEYNAKADADYRAAEARVEAAEAELRVRSQVHRDEIDGTLFKLGETQRELAELRAMLNAPTGEVWAVCRYANGFWHVIEDEDDEPLARAALACPPQQRGE